MANLPGGGIDNPTGKIDSAPRKITHTPLPNMEAPGPRMHSTPLNREKMMANLQNDETSEGDKLMMKALMDNLKAGDKEPELPNPSSSMERKAKVNQPIEQPKTINVSPKKDISQQRGFLMSFVNGFNNIIEGVWNALKSLVPMKPQTGAS
jgi:hypothetical protein